MSCTTYSVFISFLTNQNAFRKLTTLWLRAAFDSIALVFRQSLSTKTTTPHPTSNSPPHSSSPSSPTRSNPGWSRSRPTRVRGRRCCELWRRREVKVVTPTCALLVLPPKMVCSVAFLLALTFLTHLLALDCEQFYLSISLLSCPELAFHSFVLFSLLECFTLRVINTVIRQCLTTFITLHKLIINVLLWFFYNPS